METKIEYMIIKTIYNKYGLQATDKSCETIRILRQLAPDRPDDETSGFLAYNVADNNRMKMKTGRFLTRKLHLNNGFLSDVIIQRLASEINTELFPGLGIHRDTGEDIYDNYYKEVGGSSCMTGNHADYVRLYCDNPDQIFQLVVKQNGDSARAIVWKLDSGQHFMDRVYCTCEYLRDQIRQYADSQGWILRRSDEPACHMRETLVVSGLDYTDGEVPWMDTLTRYCIEDNRLTVGNRLQYSDGCLQNQDGSISGASCCNCGTGTNENDRYTDDSGEIYCEGCYHEAYSCCDRCDEPTLHENIVCVDENNYWCDDCVSSYAVQCNECNKTTATWILIDENDYCESCAESFPMCNDCGERTEEVNDCGYCEDCESDHANEIPCGVETRPLFKE